MKVNNVNAPLGVVAWVDGKIAGVAFDGEMHPAMLDHLCESTGTKLSSDQPKRTI